MINTPHRSAMLRGPAKPGLSITFSIPYYRGLAYLRLTMESVLAQSRDDWQLVVCDDSGSREAETLVAEFPRARYFANATNLGMAGNFNRCIEVAETELVTVLHADDELAPHYAELMLAAAARHPDAAAFYCDIDVIDAASKRSFSLPHFVKRRIDPSRRGEHVLAGEPGVRALMRGNFIPAAGICFRRDRLGDRRFSAQYKFVLDWYMTMGLLLDGRSIVGVPDRALRNRAHREAATEQLTREHQRFTEEMEFYDEMEQIVRARGWNDAARVAHARRLTKLHIAYRALRSLARLDLRDTRHGIQLLRRG